MENKNQNKNRIVTVLIVLTAVMVAAAVFLLFQVLSMKKTLQPQLNAMQAEGQKEVSEEISIYLPEVYYAASGLTMEIYNSQITSLCSGIERYNVVWSCDVGESLSRKYSIAATDEMIGDHELKVSVFDNELKLLAEKSCTLKVVEGELKQGFSLLQIGDSLSCDGMLYRRLQGLAQDQITFQGTRSIDGFLMEGRRAFSAADYLHETPYHMDEGEECHPFWNPDEECFDWDYYREATGFYPDAVQIFLGTNNVQAGEQNADDIVQIIDAIRKDDVMTPIYVVNTIFQGSQNGLGTWKARSGEYLAKGWDEQSQDRAVFELMMDLQEKLKDYKYLYIVPAGISMDSAYNYESEEKPANPYSERTETYEVDPVHPDKAGYYQIADVMFSVFCGTRN